MSLDAAQNRTKDWRHARRELTTSVTFVARRPIAEPSLPLRLHCNCETWLRR